MMQSETIAALATSLAAAQCEMTNPVKNCEGRVKGVTKAGTPFDYTYRYADLASGLDCVRPVLAKQGIAIMQIPRIQGDSLMLETRLMHASGEWIACVYPVCTISGDHQALTYAKRYALFSMVGVTAEDDLDGAGAENAAAPAAAAPKNGKTAATKAPPKASTQAKPAAAGAPAAERNAEPARGGYGRQKNNVDAVGAGPSVIVGPAGEPVAETLLAGIPQSDTQVGREGLRAIVSRIIQARRAIESGFSPDNIPTTHTRAALDEAFTEWESWKRAMMLSAEEMDKVSAALGKLDAENLKLDAALNKDKRQADAQASGADPESGELLRYEAPEAAA